MRPTTVELTPAQAKLWSDTRVSLMWHCPAFTHIMYSMLDNSGSEHVAIFTKDVPIAATDGKALLFNPETFFKYKLNERVFIVAHEIMHCIWNHCVLMHSFHKRGKVSYPDGSELPYDQQIMNVATDLVINDCLITSGIGTFNKDWLHDTNYAVAADSTIDAYKKVFKQEPGDGGKGKKGKGKGDGTGSGPSGQGFDEHLAPGTSEGKDANQASQERSEIEWQTQVAAAMNSARVQGKLPAGLERLLGEMVAPQVDWKDKIAAMFSRAVGNGTWDWTVPMDDLIYRDIYAPSRSGFGCGTIVVAGDTSGSISYGALPNGKPSTGDMFLAEMAGILDDCRPRRLVIMWCDAAIGRVDEAEDSGDLNTIRHKGVPGGGGTSFIPVFEKIAEMGLEPEALVYLTDLYGSFPDQKPDYPVIWGSISGPEVKVPFGEVVNIPIQVVG